MQDIVTIRKALLSREHGSKGKRGQINVILFYPNAYHIGISSLSFHRIWELTGRIPAAGALRYFLEGKGEQQFILPLDEALQPSDMHIIAFFLSYEMDYFNVAKALKLLGIPLRSSERSGLPLVIGGGIALSENPEPMADFFDAVFIGEAESSYPAFVDLVQRNADRRTVLEKASAIPGVYVPEKYSFEYNEDGTVARISGDTVKRTVYNNFSTDFSKSMVITEKGEFGSTRLIEMTRGCPCRCRFCISRTLYSPVRFAETDAVKALIADEHDVAEKFGLLGASVSFHPAFREIMEHIISQGKRFSVSSLRAEQIDQECIDLLKKGGTKTITIAPEAGSERLREMIQKGITARHIENASKCALEGGMEGIKLYFMIGLPGETWDDIDAIIQTAGLVRHVENTARKKFRKISVTISPFVPKPFTPFQWEGFEGVEEISRKINHLRKKLTAKGITVLYDIPRWAYVQAVLSRGDRKLFHYISKEGDGKEFKSLNINPAFYAERVRGEGEVFPWEVVDAGISREKLLKERNGPSGAIPS